MILRLAGRRAETTRIALGLLDDLGYEGKADELLVDQPMRLQMESYCRRRKSLGPRFPQLCSPRRRARRIECSLLQRMRGFRMPADRSDAACTVAGVRKPSMKEPAGNCRRWRRERRALWRFAHHGAA